MTASSSSSRRLRRLFEHGRWDEALRALQSDDPSVREEIESDASAHSSLGASAEPSNPALDKKSRSLSASASLSSSARRRLQKEPMPLLLLACDRGAPDEVVLEILNLDAGAASRRGPGGNLPLHVATRRHLGADVIEGLIRANPAALDCPNNSNILPRHLPHPEPCSHQALRRPAACWHQLMSDEVREESQDSRLASLHSRIDAALAELQESNDRYDGLSARVESAGEKLGKFEDFNRSSAAETERGLMDGGTCSGLEARLGDAIDAVEIRLGGMEEAARSAASREFMARAASWARQNDVGRVQQQVAERAEELRREAEVFRGHLEFRRKMKALDAGSGREEGIEVSVPSPIWSPKADPSVQ